MPTIEPTPLTAEAWIVPRGFTVGAWIVGGRSGHSRLLDHYGTQPDTAVVLDGDIGPYPAGTTVHVVLADIINRVSALENSYHALGFFTIGAWIALNFQANAVIFKEQTGTGFEFIAAAEIIRGKTNQPITIDALISKPVASSFGAAAYIIDLVC